MHCPFCGDTANRVIDTRVAQGGDEIRRRRECLECQRRFTTRERVEVVLPKITKRDERELVRQIKIFLGGPEAEAIYLKRKKWAKGWHDDLRKALDMAEYLCGYDEVERFMDSLLCWVRRILEAPANWSAVKGLAKELLKRKTVNYHAARQTITNAMRGKGNMNG